MAAIVVQAAAAWRESARTNTECDEQISQLTQTVGQLRQRWDVEKHRAADQAAAAAYLERMAVEIQGAENEVLKHPDTMWRRWSRYLWSSTLENSLDRKWREQQVQRASLRVFVERDSLGGQEMYRILRTASQSPYPVSQDRAPDRWQPGRLKYEVLVVREKLFEILQLGAEDFLRMKKEFLEQEMATVREKLEQLRAAPSAEGELRVIVVAPTELVDRVSPVEAVGELHPRIASSLIRETLSQHVVMQQTAQAKQKQIEALQEERRQWEAQIEKSRSRTEERIRMAMRLERLRADLKAAEKTFLAEQQKSLWGYVMTPYGIDPGCPDMNPASIEQSPSWKSVCEIRRTIVQARDALTELIRNRPAEDQRGQDYQVAPQDCLRQTWLRTCRTKSVNRHLEAEQSPFWDRKMKELRAELGFIPIIEAVKKIGRHDLNIDDSCRDYIVQHESATDAILHQWIEALSADLLNHNVQDGSTLTLSCRQEEEECRVSLQIRK